MQIYNYILYNQIDIEKYFQRALSIDFCQKNKINVLLTNSCHNSCLYLRELLMKMHFPFLLLLKK